MFECTRAQVNCIACTVYEDGSTPNWKAKVYTWPSCKCTIKSRHRVRYPSKVTFRVSAETEALLSYKGHYLYDYVSPERLSNALIWLKANNSLYAHINICDDWVTNAIADDQELHGNEHARARRAYNMHDSHTNEPEPTKLDANSSISLDVPPTSADISHTASSPYQCILSYQVNLQVNTAQ